MRVHPLEPVDAVKLGVSRRDFNDRAGKKRV
jgi:hypothetical protein